MADFLAAKLFWGAGLGSNRLRELLCEWRERGLPNQLLASVLRAGGADTSRVLIKSRLQFKYEEMLRNLVW